MAILKGLFCSTKGDDAEILLYDQIGLDSWSGEGISAKNFTKELRDLGAVKNISLKINSPGGDVFEGETIYNELKDHPATINVRVMSVAASIASLIAMAGDTIVMQENAKIMIHKAWAFSMGNSDDMDKMSNILKMIDESLVTSYVARTGQDAEKIRQWMREETWLLAADAVAAGFADSLVPAKEKMDAKFKLMAAFKNTPKDDQPKVDAQFLEVMKARLSLARAS